MVAYSLLYSAQSSSELVVASLSVYYDKLKYLYFATAYSKSVVYSVL